MANYNPEDWQRYVSKVPSPKSDVPAEHPTDKKHSASEEKRDAEINNQSSPSADFAALIDAIGSEGKANRAEEKREDRGKKFREYLTLIFIIATTCGVFYQAYIFSQQLDEMKGAAAQTAQLIQTNAKLAEIASEQAGAAVKQAEATDKEATAMGLNAQVAHDNMIAAERAWVGPRNAAIDGAVEIGKPVKIIIEYANTGREPALDFVSAIDGFPDTE